MYEITKPNLVVFTGPMFAGKSTKLINCYQESSSPTYNKAVFKFAKDTRYSKDAEIVTHNRLKIPCYMITTIHEIDQYLTPDITELYIDEAQFFNDIFDWLHKLINVSKDSNIKHIYLAGLNLDAKGQIFSASFNDVIDILANECHLLYATCNVCNAQATHTALLAPEYTQKMEQGTNILIGGSDIFQPVCQEHFINSL